MKTLKAVFLLVSNLFFYCVSFGQTAEAQEADSTGVFTYVEVMPEFKGNLGEYLGKNIRYPKKAQQAGIEGRVTVRFVIDLKGAIREAYVETKVHPALDAEALRVVKGMPRWKPGTQEGKAVKVYYRLPIKFTLTFDDDDASTVAQEPVDTTLLVPELPLAFADEMPRFEGDLEDYLKREIRYPQEARQAKEAGSVSVTFVVEKDGRITDAEVSKNVSPALDAEALRVVNAMPLWVPGRQGGQPVAVYQSVTVPFQP